MFLFAANLELRYEIVCSDPDTDALAGSLEAVTILRNAIEACRGLRASQSLSGPVQRIIEFVSDAFTHGLPMVTEASAVAWELLDSSVNCGFELIELSSPVANESSDFWTAPLSILASTLYTLKAQP